MALAFRSMTTAGDADGTTLVLGRPASAANDDILMLHFYAENTGLTPSISPGSWSLVASNEQTSGLFPYELFVYRNRMAGEAGDITVSWGGASVWRSGICAAYSGGITTGNPEDATPSTNESTSADRSLIATGITTANPNSMLVASGSNETGATHTWTGVTERADFGGQSLADAVQASAGASGNKTASLAGGATPSWSAILLALREQVAALAPPPFNVHRPLRIMQPARW